MGVDAVVFDWGGTLSLWSDVSTEDHPWHAYARSYDPADAAGLAARLLDAESDAWRRSRDERVSTTVDALVRTAGVDPAGERHAAALAGYLQAWAPHTRLDPDVPDLLVALRARGLRVGVLSNTLWSRAHHEEVFRRDGILHLIDGAVYTSELPWSKPDPRAFAAALSAIGDPEPARTVFVGDRPFEDIHGAQQAGMRAILVPHSRIPDSQRGPTEGRPDAVVQRLAEIGEIVARWA